MNASLPNLGPASHPKVVLLGSWRWLLVAEHANEQTIERLAKPEALLQSPSRLVPRDPPRTASIVAHLHGNGAAGQGWFIKCYLPGGFWRGLKDLFRPSRAVRAFRMGQRLQSLNIPTATPIAAGERRCCRWLLSSYLVTEEVADSCDWHQFEIQNPDGVLRRRIICAFARLLARLHDAGIAHHDPARPNILVRQSDERMELILIDLDGLQFTRRVSNSVVRKNLIKGLRGIKHNNREQLRFVAEYCKSRTSTGPLLARQWAQELGLLEPEAR